MKINQEQINLTEQWFGARNLKTELAYMSNNIQARQSITNKDILFVAWLCRKALKRIEELENATPRMHGKWETDYIVDGFKRGCQ